MDAPIPVGGPSLEEEYTPIQLSTRDMRRLSKKFKMAMRWKSIDTQGLISQGIAMENKIAALNTFYFLVPIIVVVVCIVVWLIYNRHMEPGMGLFVVLFTLIFLFALAYMYRNSVASVAQQRWEEIASRIEAPLNDIENNIALFPSAFTSLLQEIVVSGDKTFLKTYPNGGC